MTFPDLYRHVHARISRRQIRAALFALVMGAMAASVSSAQQPDDYALCADATENPDLGLDACSRELDRELRQTSARQAAILTLRGLARQTKGDIENAAVDFTDAISADSKSAAARLARGDLLRGTTQCDLAIVDYDEAIRLEPKMTRAFIGRGLCALGASNSASALADFDQAIKTDETASKADAALAWTLKTRVMVSEGELDGAVAGLGEAIAQNERSPLLYVERGLVWAAKGDSEKAFVDFDKAVELDGQNATGAAVAALGAKGQLLARQRDLDRSLVAYDEAVRLDAGQAAIFLNRGEARKGKGDVAGALSDYGRAIEIEPANVLAHNMRGDLHRDLGDYVAAIADYEKAIEKQPKDATAFSNRGIVRFYQGAYMQAADDFRRAVEELENGAYPILLAYIARARAGGARQAKVDFDKSFAKVKGAEWPYPILELFAEKRSVNGLTEAAKTQNQMCEAEFYGSQWQLIRGNRAAAKQALQRAVGMCPQNFVEQRAAVEELKRLD